MRRSFPLCLLLLFVLTARSAVAMLDPRPDRISFYFDAYGETDACRAEAESVVRAFVVLTHPRFDTIYGYEYGWAIDGNALEMTTAFTGITGGLPPSGPGWVQAGLAAPRAVTEATLLAITYVLVQDTDPVAFTLAGLPPEVDPTATVPRVLLAGDVVQEILPSAWDESHGVPLVAAVINPVPVGTTDASWDAVKSLYR